MEPSTLVPDPKHPMTLRLMLMGAKESVDIIVHEPTASALLHELDKMKGLLNDPLPSVVCRAVVSLPRMHDLDPAQDAEALNSACCLFPQRWSVRIASTSASTGAVIVDNRQAMIVEAESLYQHTSNAAVVAAFHDHFARLWATEQYAVLHENLLRSQFGDYPRQIAVVSRDFWNALIADLSRDPSRLHLLEPRRFEELVAEILKRQGCDVHVTPCSKDGGYDIMARILTPFGRLLYLVECKRWAPSRPVGVQLVNALYGVVEHGRASGGMLVTTSRFTRGALRLQRTVENRLILKDYTALVDWLREPANTALHPTPPASLARRSRAGKRAR